MASDAKVPVANAPETQSPISDIDAADRPVREQLKETSIKSSSDSVQETASNRKRSLEECREETLDSEKPRKRSRNSTPETPTVSDQNSIEPISAPQTNGNPIIVDLTISESEEETSESSYETAGSEEETSESSYETAMSEEESSESETENEEDLIAFQAKHMPIITKSNAKIWQYQWERKYGRKFTNSFKQDSDAPNKQDPDASNKQDPDASKNDTTPNTKDPELVANSKEVKKKRSHEHLETDLESPATTSATTKDPAGTDTTDIKSATDGEREKKRHRDNSQEPKPVADNGFATSAFGKAIGASPFASLNKTKETTDSTTQPASTSAFASSSLAAFAGSESSPFGTLGASTSSVFNKSPANSATNAFAAAASKPSGLSGFSGFASTSKSGGLTSFASSDSPSTLGETKPKPLGTKPFGQASNSDDDDESGDDNEDEQGGTLEAAKAEEQGSTFEAAKTDERFYEQTIATGEESELNIFTCKAKLFHFDKVWKERGIGTFKINVRNVDGKETGRMIMRADGAGRVMLNSPIFKGMSYGDTNNKPPSSKQIMLVGTEEGHTVPLLLRTSNESTAMEVYAHINGLLRE